ncbi:family 43 glycosylhydrolase [Mumia sp. DW29H23]|uniref:family 43 glycosylhydrolase n=1 Tax=Mumia sp. DW29H23 TaxID=3421241 RepID=UPI003D68E92F
MTITALGRRAVSLLGVAGLALALGVAPARAIEVPKPLISEDFADPEIVRVGSTWYAYSTNTYRHVPVASAPTIDGPWTVQGDAMPGGPAPSWATGGRTWAPDVQPNPDGSVTLTYTAWHTASGRQCIGTATASSPLGPFVPAGSPLICPLSLGGAIDANTFVDSTGARYLIWKNDGNAIGATSTIYATQTNANGTALIGSNIPLISGAAGQIIEAPDVVRRPGGYVLFYSGGSYGGCGYYTGYATAGSLGGPWSVAGAFMTQGNTGICGPGGADVVTDTTGLTGGDKVVFHGWVSGARHMFSVDLSWSGLTPVQGGTRAASLDGDGRADLGWFEANGDLRIWRNDVGFAANPYGTSVVVASGYDPARLRMADLDDDGRVELINIGTDGKIRAAHNDLGFAAAPFGTSVQIADGFTDPARVRFADLDDDGRAELISIQPSGQIWAWHNDGAFSANPYGASVVIGAGFTDPARVSFADLDADGRAELNFVQSDGQIRSWHNDGGFVGNTYGASVIVGAGFADPARVQFADLDADGRAELNFVQTDGQIRAWHNDGGFTTNPYGTSVIIGAGFTDPARALLVSAD